MPRKGTEAMRDFGTRQSAAREHDAWFRAEVEQGMREADDPDVKRIPQEDISADWRRQRAELVRRAGERPDWLPAADADRDGQ